MTSENFDVAFSFATEDEDYVTKVAEELKKTDLRIFFSPDNSVELWGKDQYSYFDDIFRKKARYAVLFLSGHYASKFWTNHERKSAQARAIVENREYILPARFDDTEIIGLPNTIAYVDLRKINPKKFAKMLVEKIGKIERVNFIPKKVDRLYKKIGAKYKKEKQIAESILYNLSEALSLMDETEKKLLWLALSHACPAGGFDNVHLNLELLKRLSNFKISQIESIFSRLKFLGFTTRILESDCEKERGEIVPEFREKIEINYSPKYELDFDGEIELIENGTYVLVAIFELLSENCCTDCAEKAFLRLDFSVLNSDAYSEVA